MGRLILVGVPPKGKNVTLYTLPLHFGRSIKGSFGGDTRPAQDIPRYLNLIKHGHLHLNSLITHECRLEEINDAIALMRSGKLAGRCIIKMDHSGV